MTFGSDRVVAAIREWLLENVTGNREIRDEYLLVENGVLASLQTLELAAFLEDRFDITIEDEEFTEENFGSINAVAGMVRGKQDRL